MGCCQSTNADGPGPTTQIKSHGSKQQDELSQYLDMSNKKNQQKETTKKSTDEKKDDQKDESKNNSAGSTNTSDESNDGLAEILLFGKDVTSAEKELRSCGGRIGLVLGATAFVAFIPRSDFQETLSRIREMPSCTVDRPNAFKQEHSEAGGTASAHGHLTAEEKKEKELIDAWDEYQDMKGVQRSQENIVWDAPNHLAMGAIVKIQPPPTSAYLRDTVSVGLIIVSGPTDDVKFTRQEANTVRSQCLQGLSFLTQAGGWEPNIRFYFEPVEISISNPNPSRASWTNDVAIRDSTMTALGFKSVDDYVDYVKKHNSSGRESKYAFCGFFVKYSITHFAYATKNLLMMHYENNGWGPRNIHAVFAHEAGHVFGASDEYAASRCDCTPSGTLAVGNFNCDNCTTFPNTKIPCLMKSNTLRVCAWSRGQLGWNYFGWGKIINNNDSTSATPTICGYNGTLYMAWKENNNNDGSNNIYITGTSIPFPVESSITLSWPNGVRINNNNDDSTDYSPTLVEFNGKLYLIWSGGISGIYISSVADDDNNPLSGNWSNGIKINDTDSTNGAVAACVFDDTLYLAWKGNDNDNIYISGTKDPLSGKWPNGIRINDNNNDDTTSSAPCMAVFNNILYISWKSNNNNNNLNRIYISGTNNPLSNKWPNGVRINNNNSDLTSDRPSMIGFEKNLYLVWKANDGTNSMYVSGSNNPLDNNWPSGQKVNLVDSTGYGVALTEFSNKVYLTWTGVDAARRMYISETQLP